MPGDAWRPYYRNMALAGLLPSERCSPLCRGSTRHARWSIHFTGDVIGRSNATLVPSVTIGRDSLIGAGIVVVRDVPDRAVVVGNPGDPIKTLAELPYES